MYQAYIPGRGPYPALFPFPLVHPAPLRPGEGFFPGGVGGVPGFMAPASVQHNSGAPILSIPSMAALRARMEKENSDCLNLVKKNQDDSSPRSLDEGQSPPKQSKLAEHLVQDGRAPGHHLVHHPGAGAEFTRFTIDQILGKNDGGARRGGPSRAKRYELSSDEDNMSGGDEEDEIEVVRNSTPDSQSDGKISGRALRREEETEGSTTIVTGPENMTAAASLETGEGGALLDDPSARFSWLQCTRYKPPKLPRIKKKDGVKKRKLGRNPRVPFTQHQVATLEQKFQRTHYLSSVDVAELSAALNLTETRVKIWFQNRRARERRERESSLQSAGNGGAGQRSPPCPTRPDAQTLASELCATQRLGGLPGAPPLHPMSPAAAAAAAAAAGMGPMAGMSWSQLAMPPNPALIAHISHTLSGSPGSAFRPVSYPT